MVEYSKANIDKACHGFEHCLVTIFEKSLRWERERENELENDLALIREIQV